MKFKFLSLIMIITCSIMLFAGCASESFFVDTKINNQISITGSNLITLPDGATTQGNRFIGNKALSIIKKTVGAETKYGVHNFIDNVTILEPFTTVSSDIVLERGGLKSYIIYTELNPATNSSFIAIDEDKNVLYSNLSEIEFLYYGETDKYYYEIWSLTNANEKWYEVVNIIKRTGERKVVYSSATANITNVDLIGAYPAPILFNKLALSVMPNSFEYVVKERVDLIGNTTYSFLNLKGKHISDLYVDENKTINNYFVDSFGSPTHFGIFTAGNNVVYQYLTPVTSNDKYDLLYNGNYYILETYKFDFTNGRINKLNNFNYIIKQAIGTGCTTVGCDWIEAEKIVNKSLESVKYYLVDKSAKIVETKNDYTNIVEIYGHYFAYSVTSLIIIDDNFNEIKNLGNIEILNANKNHFTALFENGGAKYIASFNYKGEKVSSLISVDKNCNVNYDSNGSNSVYYRTSNNIQEFYRYDNNSLTEVPLNIKYDTTSLKWTVNDAEVAKVNFINNGFYTVISGSDTNYAYNIYSLDGTNIGSTNLDSSNYTISSATYAINPYRKKIISINSIYFVLTYNA